MKAIPTLPASDIAERMRLSFKGDALDLLSELDGALLALESAPHEMVLLERVCRTIRTLKGAGGMAGFEHLARFEHRVQEAFESARGGKLAITPELLDCGFKACDVSRLMLEGPWVEDVPGKADLTSALGRLLAAVAKLENPSNPKPELVARAAYAIILKPKGDIFHAGVDPLALLDELRALGQAHITAHAEEVPALMSLKAEHCYLWWDILLVTEKDLAAVKDVFVVAEDQCEVGIRLLDDQGGAVALLGSVPAETLELFRTECEEQLERVESAALELEKHRESGADLAALFRGIHNIKGNAGLLLGQIKDSGFMASHPLQLLHEVTHGLESLLDPYRGGSGPVPQQAVETSLETCDAIRGLLRSLTHQDVGQGPIAKELLERLGVPTRRQASPVAREGRTSAFVNTTSQCVEMIALCFEELNNDATPAGPWLETYLRGVNTLSMAARFENHAELAEPLARQQRILDAAIRGGSVLVQAERLILRSALQSVRSILKRLAADSETQAGSIFATIQQAASKTAAEQRPAAATAGATTRIDQEKLDRLMRVAGELLVARGAFPLLVEKLNEGVDGALVAKHLKEAGSNISRITDELQASVMSIRMLPAKTVFQKFPRLVRDLARSLGKEVRLVIEGEGTELDKTILEQIGDPLIHVIRNSVDHGLEPPEERLAAGKDVCGELKLRAANEAGGVVIEVSDDGRGLDAERLKRKALERGLLTVEAAAAMSEEAAFQFTFLPGFSTAEKVTGVSGRGVGMDVVRSNIHNLQGTVKLHSKRGRGTTLLMKLPTSLMISKGILLEAGTQEYILPLSNIREMVKLPRQQAREYRGLKVAEVRGRIYPMFTLAETFGLTPLDKPELSVAIVEAGSVRYGLVVDRFVSEVEVLVKPLTGGLEECREFQGAAIMGDGRVVLVLNALECHSLERAA
jgi:two-component system, chemotaxis family, sensor kinase CheA